MVNINTCKQNTHKIKTFINFLKIIKFAMSGDVVQWWSVYVLCTKPGVLASAVKNKIAKISTPSKAYLPSIFLEY